MIKFKSSQKCINKVMMRCKLYLSVSSYILSQSIHKKMQEKIIPTFWATAYDSSSIASHSICLTKVKLDCLDYLFNGWLGVVCLDSSFVFSFSSCILLRVGNPFFALHACSLFSIISKTISQWISLQKIHWWSISSCM